MQSVSWGDWWKNNAIRPQNLKSGLFHTKLIQNSFGDRELKLKILLEKHVFAFFDLKIRWTGLILNQKCLKIFLSIMVTAIYLQCTVGIAIFATCTSSGLQPLKCFYSLASLIEETMHFIFNRYRSKYLKLFPG